MREIIRDAVNDGCGTDDEIKRTRGCRLLPGDWTHIVWLTEMDTPLLMSR